MSLPKQLLEAKICNKDSCEIKRKLDQYEDPEDLTLFYMWLDEKAKDKMKQLQEENEKLKEDNDFLKKELSKLVRKYLKDDLLNILQGKGDE